MEYVYKTYNGINHIGEINVKRKEENDFSNLTLNYDMITHMKEIEIIRDKQLELICIKIIINSKNLNERYTIIKTEKNKYSILESNDYIVKRGNLIILDELKLLIPYFINEEVFSTYLDINSLNIMPLRIFKKNNLQFNILIPEFSYCEYNKDNLFLEYYENYNSKIRIYK
ncbi:hypothetical protein [Proteiniborus sp.]|uniref:hypothetical protein n=1 Tax=Proteiniborus sp. TaxID=2079015 RepID=UPI0033204E4F